MTGPEGTNGTRLVRVSVELFEVLGADTVDWGEPVQWVSPVRRSPALEGLLVISGPAEPVYDPALYVRDEPEHFSLWERLVMRWWRCQWWLRDWLEGRA